MTINGNGNTQIQTIGAGNFTMTQNSGTFTIAGTTSLSIIGWTFNALNVSGNFTFNENIVVNSDLNVSGNLSSTNRLLNFANGGTLDMHIGIPHQSLKSQRAAPIATDTVYGNKFHFESLKTKIISSTNIPQGIIYKNCRKQNLYGFTIKNNNIAELKTLVLTAK